MSGFATSPLNDAQADAILAAIRPLLRIVLTSASRVEPGQLLRASLVPASPQIDASELVNGFVNLAFTAKDVLFTGAGVTNIPESGDLQGDTLLTAISGVSGQPFPPALPILNGGPTTNPSGLLGQLFGGLALPNLKVRVDITWIVRNQAGTTLTEGTDFIAQQGLGSPDVSLALPPVFRELRLDTLQNPIGEVYCLAAHVVLRLGSRSLPFDVGPVPFVVLPLFIPTVVALFSEPNFGLTHDSTVALIVPEHSPFASAEPLFKTLKNVESALGNVRSIARIAAWLLGLSELVSSVPEQPRIRFVAANEIAKLGTIKIKRRPWYQFLGSDPNFDDKVYSILLLGLPGTEVEFFNDTNFKRLPSSHQGMFSLRTNVESWVSVRTLDTSNDVRPVTFPPNPSDNRYVPDFEADTTGDAVWHTDMSSVRFKKSWLDAVGREVQNPPSPPQLICAELPRKEPPTRHR